MISVDEIAGQRHGQQRNTIRMSVSCPYHIFRRTLHQQLPPDHLTWKLAKRARHVPGFMITHLSVCSSAS